MPEPRPTLDDVTGKAKEKAVHAERDRALTKSSGTNVPARGAIFLLSEAGHRNAGYTEAEAKALFALSMKYAKHLNAGARREYGVDYDVYEIHVFDSLDSLLRKRPNASRDRKWHQVVLVTHAQAEQPQELENDIFLGDRAYSALDLQEAAAQREEAVRGFRQAIDRDATLRVIGCAPATHGPELGIYLRELAGTRGNVILPRVDVDFTTNGLLGTPEPGTTKLRALRPEEWLEIPPIPEANRP